MPAMNLFHDVALVSASQSTLFVILPLVLFYFHGLDNAEITFHPKLALVGSIDSCCLAQECHYGINSEETTNEAEEELEGAVGSSEPDINARLSIALKTTDDEEDEPPELKNQDNLPPTPYEECLDLKIFETLAQQESQAEFQHAEGKNNDTTSLRYIDGDGASPYRSTESSVKPSPVCCAAATPTLNSGHHGDSCGSSSSSAPCSGVRRKAKVASTSLEEPVANGTKKKVRPNGSLKSSPSQEYLQIWTTASGDVEAVKGIPVQKQVTSPTIQVHRPLERSWPPKHQRKQQLQQGSE
ncbi:hypothetical protein RP20_CCG016042 [Aedes albopictus]|nr:hypothetical protein RP20_CCG016042 [Aedes albopictus]